MESYFEKITEVFKDCLYWEIGHFTVIMSHKTLSLYHMTKRYIYQGIHARHQDSFTASLHSPNGRHLPAVGVVPGDCQWFLKSVEIPLVLCPMGVVHQSIQSSAIIRRSNIVRHYVNDYRNWGRISIRCWIHKRHPIPHPNGWAMGGLLWILVRKLTVL